MAKDRNNRPTDQEIQVMNQRESRKTKKDFAGFKAAMAENKCWICKQPIGYFDESKPCMHWLLRPSGFRKKHFPLVYQSFSAERIEAFLRWVAATTGPFKGINDIKEEADANNIMAVTIVYKNLEWSLSCPKGCLAGIHRNQPPHYHFQMRIDQRPFIDYSDFHIPLTDYDLWVINIKQGEHPYIKHTETYGMGIGRVLAEVDPEILLTGMRTSDDYSEAPFNIQTLVEADPGTTISGGVLDELLKESKETGAPMAQLIRRLKNVKATVIIEPGPAIPKSARRTPRKRGRGKV